MATQNSAREFTKDGWEPLDSYWSSPLSYWVYKSLRVEPPIPLRVRVLGRVVSESDEGWINYGGPLGMFVATVEGRGQAGQRVRVTISDDPVQVE